MNTRLNYLVKVLFAFAVVVLFVQCKGDAQPQNTSTDAGSTISSEFKVAYVEMDSLYMNYNFWKDVTEAMVKKQEDVRNDIANKYNALQKEANSFQQKLQNNAFLSRERAEQEQQRIVKKEQDIQKYQMEKAQEFEAEAQKNELEIRDAIDAFLNEYNKEKGYTFIFTNNSMNPNFLYADKAYDITDEVIKGLNARYSNPSTDKKEDNK